MAGSTLGTAYVQIVPSADGIKGSITEALGGESEAAGESSGSKIASFAKKAIKAAAIGKFFKDALDEGGKLQQSYIGGLETLYSGAEDEIRSYAREAAAAGISMNNFSEQAVSFGAALKRSFGDDVSGAADAANRAIMAMADNSAKMGTDIESIQMAYQGFAKDNYTMLDNLKLGYGGTKTEMERLIKDAASMTDIQEELGVAVDANDMSFSNVANAIQVVQKNLGIAGVAAQEAEGTLTGSFSAMQASWQNLIGSMAIGENVDQALVGLTKSFSNWAFGNLIPMVGNVVKSLPKVVVTLIAQGGPQILSGISGLFSSLATNLTSLADNMSSDQISSWVKTTLPKILKAADDILANFIEGMLRNAGKIAIAIGKIGLVVIKGLGADIWGKVTEAANGVKDRFLAPINKLKDMVKKIIDQIKGFFKFTVPTPHIPVPHFSINPSGWKVGDLLKGSIPKLGVKWFAEGGIVDEPTLFGAGEAGPEAILPLDKLRDYTGIDYDRMAAAILRALSGAHQTIEVTVDGKEVARATAPYMEPEINRIQKRNSRKLGYV